MLPGLPLCGCPIFGPITTNHCHSLLCPRAQVTGIKGLLERAVEQAAETGIMQSQASLALWMCCQAS